MKYTLIIGKHYADTRSITKRAFSSALRDRAIIDILEFKKNVRVLTLSLDDEKYTIKGRHRYANILRPGSILALADANTDGWPGLRAVSRVYIDYLASVPQYILKPHFKNTLKVLATLLEPGAIIVIPTHVSATEFLTSLSEWCGNDYSYTPLAREKHPLWLATARVNQPYLVSNSGNETFMQLTRI